MADSDNSDSIPDTPYKLTVSHADNHLFHLTIFRPIPIDSVLSRVANRSRLQLDFANYCRRGHRSQRRSASVPIRAVGGMWSIRTATAAVYLADCDPTVSYQV